MPRRKSAPIALLKYNGREGAGAFYPVSTPNEAQHLCKTNSYVWFLSDIGDARQAKVNGRVRRWKKDPSRIEIPLKYGLSVYWTMTASDIYRLLIEVKHA